MLTAHTPLARAAVLIFALLAGTPLLAQPATAAAAASGGGTGAPAAASPPPVRVTPPVLAVRSQELANGLRVLLVEDHTVPLVSVEVWYHVGSKNERPGRTGFAHLFEHLMFKGSAHVGPEEHSHFIGSIGGRDNATTDWDRTLYFEIVPSNYLERMLWMEADRMQTLDVSEANFLAEREVVKEERRLRVDDPPFGRLLEVVFAKAYTVHPYHTLPIGSMADLDAATIEDVRDFYRTWYVPNNATLVIAGDLDPTVTLAAVERYFGPIPRGGAPLLRDLPAEPPQTAPRREVAYDAKAPLAAVVLTYHVPAASSPDTYPLEVASHILSAGQSSRLYRKLVYESQIAINAGGETDSLEDPGVFLFSAILQQGQKPETGEAALLAEIDRLRNEPVPAAELEKAKNQIIAEHVFARETSISKASAVGRAAVILGDVDLVNHDLEHYARVTAEDIQRVARTYFRPESGTTVYMLPEAMRPGGAPPATSASPPAPPTPPAPQKPSGSSPAGAEAP
jgi:zinc protease